MVKKRSLFKKLKNWLKCFLTPATILKRDIGWKPQVHVYLLSLQYLIRAKISLKQLLTLRLIFKFPKHSLPFKHNLTSIIFNLEKSWFLSLNFVKKQNILPWLADIRGSWKGWSARLPPLKAGEIHSLHMFSPNTVDVLQKLLTP